MVFLVEIHEVIDGLHHLGKVSHTFFRAGDIILRFLAFGRERCEETYERLE
jgi:hypothetical protein